MGLSMRRGGVVQRGHLPGSRGPTCDKETRALPEVPVLAPVPEDDDLIDEDPDEEEELPSFVSDRRVTRDRPELNLRLAQIRGGEVVMQPEDDDWETLDHGEPEFLRLTPYDRPERRALWVRWVRADSPHVYQPAPEGVPRHVELRAGREGGDARLELREGHVLTARDLDDLVDVLLTMRFGLEDVAELAGVAWKTE